MKHQRAAVRRPAAGSPVRPQSRPQSRPGAAMAVTDAESGEEGAGPERDLYALKVMRDRGLISRDDYDRRCAEILGGND